MAMYVLGWFNMLSEVKIELTNKCSSCNQYSICKSGCIGQKIIANYTQDADKVKELRRCINSRDLKCMR